MIRVLIADSYPIVRSGLKQVLSQSNEIKVIGETASHAETLRKVQTTDCQLLVLSVDLLQGMLGFLSNLKRLRPRMRVLLVGLKTNIELGVRSLKAGASGYINIQSTVDEFVKAVRSVAYGQKYVCSEIVDSLTNNLADKDETPHRQLSDREFDVLRLLGAGKRLTDVATILGLGKSTVATYRKRILEKLHLQNSAEIMRYAIEHRVVFQ